MKAIFLDRDGVINQAVVVNGRPYPPKNVDSLVILPGVAEALCKLKAAGYRLLVVTNQPDVGRGKIKKESVEEINDFLLSKLCLDEISVCFHSGVEECECRKPKPGMLLEFANRLGLTLEECYIVGDRWKDIEAGLKAGCKTVFINYEYDEYQPESYDFESSSLAEATMRILEG